MNSLVSTKKNQKQEMFIFSKLHFFKLAKSRTRNGRNFSSAYYSGRALFILFNVRINFPVKSNGGAFEQILWGHLPVLMLSCPVKSSTKVVEDFMHTVVSRWSYYALIILRWWEAGKVFQCQSLDWNANLSSNLLTKKAIMGVCFIFYKK